MDESDITIANFEETVDQNQIQLGESILADNFQDEKMLPFKKLIRRFFKLVIREIEQREALTGAPSPIKKMWITVGVGLIMAIKETKLIKEFSTRSHLHWKHIFDRDITKFRENLYSILNIPQLKTKTKIIDRIVNYLTAVDSNGKLYIDINEFWNILNNMVVVSCLYIHNKRQPEIIDGRLKYMNPYMKDINIITYAKEGGFVDQLVVAL